MSQEKRFMLDKHHLDGSFQIVDLENKATWGRFHKDEESPLEVTVNMLNKLNDMVNLKGLLIIQLQNELDKLRSQMIYDKKYNQKE